MKLILANQEPFARGGNRLCYVHPCNNNRCVKVRRPDFTLEDRRRKKGFPKNLKPLSSFDDNREEFKVMTLLRQRFGAKVFNHCSICYGFEDTDMGNGLVSELIRDESGHISHTLKQYLWDHDYTENCKAAVSQFSEQWVHLGVPSRDLLLHNIVVQRKDDGTIERLVVIDGLGSSNLLPLWANTDAMLRRKAKRKIDNLISRIDNFRTQRGEDTFPGFHGQLIHEGVDDKESSERL